MRETQVTKTTNKLSWDGEEIQLSGQYLPNVQASGQGERGRLHPENANQSKERNIEGAKEGGRHFLQTPPGNCT